MQNFLKLKNMTKRYGGVTALNSADFSCDAGKIHAILGENGAGKSTLIKIISGVVQQDEGTLALDEKEINLSSPLDAIKNGIVCIFQELSLVPDLTVAENICLYNPPRKGLIIDKKEQNRIALETLKKLNIDDIPANILVSDLPLSRKQVVEIAKAIRLDPQILILDEATSALTAKDVEKVFTLLKELREEGKTILYISHRMNEIEELADDCTVFRNGQHVATFANGTKKHDEIIEMMIGRDYEHTFPPKPEKNERTEAILEVENLSWEASLKGITLSVGKGEIIGLGGLDGQGQREFLLALFGVLSNLSGTIKIDGTEVQFNSPKAAKKNKTGVALIPEDRKTEGLLLPMSISNNLSLAIVDQLSNNLVINNREEKTKIDEMVKLLNIKVGHLNNNVDSLSGGNQQKVVIGKWLLTEAKIILLNDPTRGIDVGTKQEIYVLLRKLADAGASILFYSTDYDELIGCCDHVAVFYDGQIVQTLSGKQITERALISSALNIHETNNLEAVQ